MPTVLVKRGRTEKSRLDTAAYLQLAQMLSALDPLGVYIEDVGGMPGDGASSMFTFGHATGAIEMAWLVLGVPILTVHPATWKAALRCPAGKGGSRALASRLMPAHAHLWPLKKHHGRAEAALIGEWATRFGVFR